MSRSVVFTCQLSLDKDIIKNNKCPQFSKMLLFKEIIKDKHFLGLVLKDPNNTVNVYLICFKPKGVINLGEKDVEKVKNV